MVLQGIDCASPAPSTAALKAHNIKFVCRYLSTKGNPKNISSMEAKRLRDAGIDVVLVFETTSHRALDGRNAGANDAWSAMAQAKALGFPAGTPIYFAVDFDANSQDILTCRNYIAGAASVLGENLTGVYGGIHIVKSCLDVGTCKYAWQTYAWSGGAWDKRAQIQQYLNAQVLSGVSVDFDRALFPDFGQVPRTLIHNVVKHLPGPAQKPAWFWLALKQFLKNRKS